MSKETEIFVIYEEGHKAHQTRKTDPCEGDERVEVLREALEKSDLGIIWKKPKVYERPLILRTHSQRMIEALKRYSALAEQGDHIFTSFYKDLLYSTPITYGTFKQALISASCSIEAAEVIRKGSTKLAFSLSRPPGHHAGREFYHGFCFINNAALAARNLKEKAGKVAILDFDIHHPDGTQDIFYNTGEVLLVSLHADPNLVFPYTGFQGEQGEGEGKGMIVNIPLEVGISAKGYKRKFDEAIKVITDYNPDAMIIEAGFDGHSADFPPGGKSLTELSEEDFSYIGDKIGSLDVPCCVILEGGYNLKYLPNSFLNFFCSLESRLIKGRKTI